MVFPSVNPLYQLDPPTWNQQEQPLVHHQQQFQPVAAPQDGANPGPARANSMAERARAAKIPLPEQALRCPRCDSTNTKFCYFNNYSLTQPRHFCKACRRYWTRGGALRNVPVGGGTRRNNRRSSSKKPSSSSTTTTTSTSAPARQSGAGVSSSSSIATSAAGAAAAPLFMTPLHPMMDYGSTSGSSIGLGFSGLDQMELQQQWRLNSQIQNQFPFLGLGGLGLDPQQSIHYPSANTITNYGSECGGGGGGEAVGPTGSDLISTQMASVKMEEQHARGRQYINNLGMNMNAINQRNDQQFWAGVNSGSSSGGGGGGGGGSGSVGGWMTNLSGFNSSSTGNLL